MLSIDTWEIFVPLIVAIVAWVLNERSKRSWEQYKRKEERYQELLKSLRGFYVATQDTTQKSVFLEQVNLCWLYSPDEVILKAYSFLDTVKTGASASEDEKSYAAGELVIAIRKDLLPSKFGRKTKLKVQDFRHFRAT